MQWVIALELTTNVWVHFYAQLLAINRSVGSSSVPARWYYREHHFFLDFRVQSISSSIISEHRYTKHLLIPNFSCCQFDSWICVHYKETRYNTSHIWQTGEKVCLMEIGLVWWETSPTSQNSMNWLQILLTSNNMLQLRLGWIDFQQEQRFYCSFFFKNQLH